MTNSILKYYGAPTHHSTLPLLDKLLEKNYKNVVLMVFDGLGVNILENNLPEDSFFRKHIFTEISSVYPCTTTAALTSILSGLNPCEHGWVGWSCYFKEVDKCVNLFNNADSFIKDGESVSTEHLANKYMGFETIFEQIDKATNRSIKTCAVSPFTNYFANTCEGICEHLKTLCNEDGQKLIYAYHYQPDHDIHDLGCYTETIKAMVMDYNNQIETLCNGLEDTLFIITADHGMTNITMKCIEDFPQINECLKRLITIEPRCCSFFIKDEFMNTFAERFKNTFGDKFMLFMHDEFIDKKLLGDGKQHAKIDDFIGDYVAVAVSDVALWYKNNADEWNDFKAAHAGLCEDEMTVPLIVIEEP